MPLFKSYIMFYLLSNAPMKTMDAGNPFSCTMLENATSRKEMPFLRGEDTNDSKVDLRKKKLK